MNISNWWVGTTTILLWNFSNSNTLYENLLMISFNDLDNCYSLTRTKEKSAYCRNASRQGSRSEREGPRRDRTALNLAANKGHTSIVDLLRKPEQRNNQPYPDSWLPGLDLPWTPTAPNPVICQRSFRVKGTIESGVIMNYNSGFRFSISFFQQSERQAYL